MTVTQRCAVFVCLAASLTACGSSSSRTNAGPTGSASTSPMAPPSTGPASTTTGSGSATACQRILKDLAGAPSVLATTAANTKDASSNLKNFADRLRQDAQGATGRLQSDLQNLVSKIEAAAHNPGSIDVGGLTKEARAVAGDCTAGPAPSSIVS